MGEAALGLLIDVVSESVWCLRLPRWASTGPVVVFLARRACGARARGRPQRAQRRCGCAAAAQRASAFSSFK